MKLVFLYLTYCLQVTFTSLDFMLHTEALLSAINFLSAALSFGSMSSTKKEIKPKTEDKPVSAKSGQYSIHVTETTTNLTS